jgi:hypothetical protein
MGRMVGWASRAERCVNDDDIRGTLTYQACNDTMCFTPVGAVAVVGRAPATGPCTRKPVSPGRLIVHHRGDNH